VSAADPNFFSSDNNNRNSRRKEALSPSDWVQSLARLCTLFSRSCSDPIQDSERLGDPSPQIFGSSQLQHRKQAARTDLTPVPSS
jgi:hypothetical protein